VIPGRSPITRRCLLIAMAAGAGFMTMLLGAAQGPTYPNRPITLVVGLAAGSGQGAATAGVRDTHGEIANSK
jgi:hypothetical protein